MRSIRSFVAIDCPEAVRQEMQKIQQGLQQAVRSAGGEGEGGLPGISWTRSAGLHLTLKFLGDILQEQLPQIEEAMREVAGAFRPFAVRVEGTGVFPNINAPRVIWVGVRSGGQDLARLQQALEDRLEGLGFGRETRPFHPHLTLGRIRSEGTRRNFRLLGQLLSEWVKENQETVGGEFAVDEVVLMKSDLQPGGAVYTTLAALGLAAA